jgi:hypothetical protein
MKPRVGSRRLYRILEARWAERPDTLNARSHLAAWTGEAGDAAGAFDQFAALVPVRERVSGPDHPHTLAARSQLAVWTGEAGDPASAGDRSRLGQRGLHVLDT